MAVTANTNGVVFADSTYQTTAFSSSANTFSLNGNSLTVTASHPSHTIITDTNNEQSTSINLPDATTVANGRSFTFTNIAQTPIRIKASSFTIGEVEPSETLTVTNINKDNGGSNGNWISNKRPLRWSIGTTQRSSSAELTNNGNQNYTTYRPVAVAISTTKFLVLYPQKNSTTQWKAIVGTYGSDGSTITWGSPVDCPAGYSSGHHNGDRYSAGPTLLSFSESNNVWAATNVGSGQKYFITISVSGTTPSFPSGASLYIGTGGSFGYLTPISGNSFLATFYNDDGYWYCGGYKSTGSAITAGGSYVTITSNYRPTAMIYLNPQVAGTSLNYAVLSKYVANGLVYTNLQTFIVTMDGGVISTITTTINGTTTEPWSGGYNIPFVFDNVTDQPAIASIPDGEQNGNALNGSVMGSYYTKWNFTGRTLSQKFFHRINNDVQFNNHHLYLTSKVVAHPKTNRFYFFDPGIIQTPDFVEIGRAPRDFNVCPTGPALTGQVHTQARFNGSVVISLTTSNHVVIGSTINADGGPTDTQYLAGIMVNKLW